MRDRIGSHRIRFRRIGLGQGCVYQTTDPVIADYIRSLIPTGQINGLYEDYQQSSPLRSKYTDKLFPNTEQGRIALGAYDLAIEREAIEREKEVNAQSVPAARKKTR